MEVSAILIVDNASSDSANQGAVNEELMPASSTTFCNDFGRSDRKS